MTNIDTYEVVDLHPTVKPVVFITYLIYIILYETLVIGGCGYAVFVLHHSGWWFVLSVLFSGGAYTPSKWNRLLTGKEDKEDKK